MTLQNAHASSTPASAREASIRLVPKDAQDSPPAFDLISAHVTEELGRLFEIRVKLATPQGSSEPFEDLAEDILGRNATLSLSLESGNLGPWRYFNGIVSDFEHTGQDGSSSTYDATIVPWLWLLTRRTNCRIFQNKTVPDIVREIIGEHGYGGSVRDATAATYHPRLFCVQFRETDFDFVSRLLEEEGIYFAFEHCADGHTLVLYDSVASLPDVDTGGPPPTSRIHFSAASTGAAIPALSLWNWRVSSRVQSRQVRLRDFDYQRPPDPVEEYGSDSSVEFPTREVFDYPARFNMTACSNDGGLQAYQSAAAAAPATGASPIAAAAAAAAAVTGAVRSQALTRSGYPSQQPAVNLSDEQRRYTTLRLQEITCQRLIVRATTNVRSLRAGDRFDLADHPHADYNARFIIRNVKITITVPWANSSSRGNGDRPLGFGCELTAIPYGDVQTPNEFRLRRVTPRPVIQGPQTAIVVGTGDDSDPDPDALGRVHVKFHWDRRTESDATSSCRVRVSQTWAGSGHGSMHIPDIKDEVIVEFLDGDPDRPIITGRVYNGDGSTGAKPPLDLPDNKHKVVVAKDDFGNEIILDATEGDEHIRIYGHANETLLEIGKEGKVELTTGNELSFTAGNSFSFSVGASASTSIGASYDLSVGTSMSASIGPASLALSVGDSMSATFGWECTYTHGGGYGRTNQSIMTESMGDNGDICHAKLQFDAQKGILLVGGGKFDAPGTKNTGILHLNSDETRLSFGKDNRLAEPAFAIKNQVILANLLAAAASAAGGAAITLAAQTAIFDKEKERKEGKVHGAWLGMAGALGVSVAANVLSQRLLRQLGGRPSPGLPQHYVPHGCLVMKRTGVKLGAGELWDANGPKIDVSGSSKQVAIEVGSAKVLITDSKITLTAPNVEVQGNLKVTGVLDHPAAKAN